MNSPASAEIRRRGIHAADSLLDSGLSHIIKDNLPNYAVIPQKDRRQLISEFAEAGLSAS